MIENSVVSYESLGQGRYRKEIQLKPIHYFRNGLWRPIGNVLGNSGDPNLTIGVNELFDFRIRDRLSGTAPVIHIGKGNNQVRYTPLDTANTDAIVTGNSVLYPEAWANADLKITVGGHIIRKDIILRAGHPQSFAFRIDDKSNMNDDLVGSEFYITRPYLYKTGKESIYLDWAKTSQGGKMVLTATLPEGSWEGWTLDPTYTSQPNPTDGMDTYMSGGVDGSPDYNFGTYEAVDINNGYDGDYYTYTTSALIKFNLSSIQAGSTIDSATLYTRSVAIETGMSVGMYRTIRDWVELQATANLYKTSNSWSTAGCRNSTTDYNSSLVATIANTLGDNNTSLSTSLIQTMIPSGSFTNNGFVIHQLDARDRPGAGIGTPTYTFYSSDYTTTTTYRPKLTIVYTESGGSTVKPAYYYAQL